MPIQISGSERNFFYLINGNNDAPAGTNEYYNFGQGAGTGAFNNRRAPVGSIVTWSLLGLNINLHTSTGGTDSHFDLMIDDVASVVILNMPQGTTGIFFSDVGLTVTQQITEMMAQQLVFGSLTTAINTQGRSLRGLTR